MEASLADFMYTPTTFMYGVGLGKRDEGKRQNTVFCTRASITVALAGTDSSALCHLFLNADLLGI